MQINVEQPQMSDPHQVPDTFASGLGDIEELGGCYRFTLFAKVGDDEYVVAARIVVPHESLPSILYLAAKHVGLSLVRAARFDRTKIH